MIFNISIYDLKQDYNKALSLCSILNPSNSHKSQWPLMVSDIWKYIQFFRNDISIWIETDYIDRSYRDAYSHYFSTKLRPYDSRCLRLSFTDTDVDYAKVLTSPDKDDETLKKYYGFMVLRPIYPGTVGRTVISPSILTYGSDIKICKTPIRSSFLGLKTFVEGFPHSSQDSEFSTCAETSIWSILQYFGNKYPEYRPILPAQIHDLLDKSAYQRHIPSTGLIPQDISFVLKQYGFECNIYDQPIIPKDPPCPSDPFTTDKSYRDHLYSILTCYIESGIPTLVCVWLDDIGHCIVCIGEKDTPRSDIAKAPKHSFTKYLSSNKNSFQRWIDVPRDLVFNDDNNPCYSLAAFDNATPQHKAKHPKVQFVIAPLYSKIYLDAANAIEISERICSEMALPDNVVLRTFLASGNSYRNYLMRDTCLPPAYKDLFLEYICFPKFIWVTEISDDSEFCANHVNGVVILDATQPNSIGNLYPIVSCYKNNFGFIIANNSEFKKNSLTLQFKTNQFSNL